MFDDPEAALAHAFHSNGQTCREIDMKSEENWYLGVDGLIPQDKFFEYFGS